jgi:hypothetical protein
MAGECMGSLPPGYERVRLTRLISNKRSIILRAFRKLLDGEWSFDRAISFCSRNSIKISSVKTFLNPIYAGKVRVVGKDGVERLVDGKQESAITLQEHFRLKRIAGKL